MAGKATYRQDMMDAVIRVLEDEGVFGRPVLTVQVLEPDNALEVVSGRCGEAFGGRVLMPFDDLGLAFTPAEQALWAERFLNITGDTLPAVEQRLIEDGLYLLATWAHEDGDL